LGGWGELLSPPSPLLSLLQNEAHQQQCSNMVVARWDLEEEACTCRDMAWRSCTSAPEAPCASHHRIAPLGAQQHEVPTGSHTPADISLAVRLDAEGQRARAVVIGIEFTPGRRASSCAPIARCLPPRSTSRRSPASPPVLPSYAGCPATRHEP
jgi:hypothetical protein